MNEFDDEAETPQAEEDGTTNTDEDNEEKEFEPTVDMLMNEFDDEATIDEEEALGQEDEADELSALQSEQDMPIEELLKMYGYGNPPPAPDPKEEEEEAEKKHEVIESNKEETEPEQ